MLAQKASPWERAEASRDMSPLLVCTDLVDLVEFAESPGFRVVPTSLVVLET